MRKIIIYKENKKDFKMNVTILSHIYENIVKKFKNQGQFLIVRRSNINFQYLFICNK